MLYLILNNLKQIFKNKFQIFIACLIFGLGLGFIIGFRSYKNNESNTYLAKTKADKVPNFVVTLHNYWFNTLVSLQNLYKNQPITSTKELLWSVQALIQQYDQKYKQKYSLTSWGKTGKGNLISDDWDRNFINDASQRVTHKSLLMSLQKINIGENDELTNINVQLKSFFYTTVTGIQSPFYRNVLLFTNFSNKINISNKDGLGSWWNNNFDYKNLDSFFNKMRTDGQSLSKFQFDFSQLDEDQKLVIPCIVSEKWAHSHNLIASSSSYLNGINHTKKNPITQKSMFQLSGDSPFTYAIVGYTDNPEFYYMRVVHNSKVTIPFTIATPIIVPNLALQYIKYIDSKLYNLKINDSIAELSFNLFNNMSDNPLALSQRELDKWQKFLNGQNFKNTFDSTAISISTLGSNLKNEPKKGLMSPILNNYEQFQSSLKNSRYFVYIFAIVIIIISAILLVVIIKKQFNSLARHFGVLKAHGYTNWQIAVSWFGQSALMSFMSFIIASLVSLFFLMTLMRDSTNLTTLFYSTSYSMNYVTMLIVLVVAFIYIWFISIITTLFSLRTKLLTLLYQGNETSSLGTIGRKIAFLFAWTPFTIRFGILTIISGNIRTIILITFILLTSMLITIGILTIGVVSKTLNLTHNNNKWNFKYDLKNIVDDKSGIHPSYNFNFYGLNSEVSKENSPKVVLEKSVYLRSKKFWETDGNFNSINKKSELSSQGIATFNHTKIDQKKDVINQTTNPDSLPALLLKFNRNKDNSTTAAPHLRTYYYTADNIKNLLNKRFYLSRDSFTDTLGGKQKSVFDIFPKKTDCIREIKAILSKNIDPAYSNIITSLVNSLIQKYYELFNNSKIHFQINNKFYLIMKNSDYVGIAADFHATSKAQLVEKTYIKFIDPNNRSCLNSFKFLHHKNEGFAGSSAEKNYENHTVPIIISTTMAKKEHWHNNQEIPIPYLSGINSLGSWKDNDLNNWKYKIVNIFKSAQSSFVFLNSEINTAISKEIISQQTDNVRKWPIFFYEIAPFSGVTITKYLDSLFGKKDFADAGNKFTWWSNSDFNYSYSDYISQYALSELWDSTHQKPKLQAVYISAVDQEFNFKITQTLLQQIKVIMIIVGLVYILVSAAGIISLNYFLFNENIRAITIMKIMGTSSRRINNLFVMIYFPIIVFTFTIGFFISIEIVNAIINFLNHNTKTTLITDYTFGQYITALSILLAIYFVTVTILNKVVKKIKINRFLI